MECLFCYILAKLLGAEAMSYKDLASELFPFPEEDGVGLWLNHL